MVLLSVLASANDKEAMKANINEAGEYLKKAYTQMQAEKYSVCERYASIASTNISMTLAMNTDGVKDVDTIGRRFKMLTDDLQKTCKNLKGK